MQNVQYKLHSLFILIFALIIIGFPVNSGSDNADSSLTVSSKQDSSVFYRDRMPLTDNEGSSIFGYLVRVIFVTAVLIVCIVFGAKFYRKWVFKQMGPVKNRIRVLGRQAVGPKQFIVLVSIEGKKYALGVTDQSVNILTDLGPMEENDEMEEMPVTTGSFSDLLKKLTGGKNE
jgi:flagellar biogenesis protein FliO